MQRTETIQGDKFLGVLALFKQAVYTSGIDHGGELCHKQLKFL
jgi:hypothetical protein